MYWYGDGQKGLGAIGKPIRGNLFSCVVCRKQDLSKENFSKTQLSKLKTARLYSLRCLDCTPSDGGNQNKKQKLDHPQSAELCRSEVMKHNDPSIEYLKKPLGAPIVTQFIQFSRSLEFEPFVFIGPYTGEQK